MTMSPDQQWISTVSMNRFYDHCYLIECAYHIISRYCCSFTNLLTHDDGSIPYYLVQKVKIAVEYGQILLNSRYRPFQHHLRGLGAYDYIDQHQYEGLCVHWNTIKAETQVVEMFFNQISLLIYPVVSATSLSFIESKQNEDVSALTKINAIIHNLIIQNESVANSKNEKSKRIVPKRPKYFTEEELGVFIVNNIIEPLFDDEDEPLARKPAQIHDSGNDIKYDYSPRHGRQRHSYKKTDHKLENYQIKFDKVEILRSNVFVEDKQKDDKSADFYNINLSNDIIFKFEDDVVMNCARYNSQFRFANRIYGFETSYRKFDAKGDIAGDKKFADVRKYEAKKLKDAKFSKKNHERGKFSYGSYEFINKKFADSYQNGKNIVRVE